MRTTQILFTTLGAMGVIALLGAGCGDSDAIEDDGGAGGTGGSTQTSTSTTQPVTSSSTGGGSTVPDESTSCADAPVIAESQNGLMQPLFRSDDNIIGEGGDEDFFIIQGIQAGEWWQFGTDANPDDNPMLIDTVLSVYTEDGSALLATVDDSFPRTSTDSEMFHRFEEGGNYCIKVEEFSSWSDGTPEGGPSYIYSVFGIPINFAAYDQHNQDTEPNDDQTAADTNGDISVLSGDMSDQWFATFMGVTGTANDVDVYRFVAPTDAIGFDLDLTSPDPENGYGSTGGPGAVKVYDSVFGLVAEIDATKRDQGLDGMSAVPVVAGQTYYVAVEKPAGQTVGTNDFYVLKSFTRDTSNPQEGGGMTTPTDTGTNDTSAGAEAPASQDPQTLATGETVTSTFVGGELPEGDVDYWTFDTAGMPQSGDQFTLICSSWSIGSGVRGMTVTLEDQNGAPVQTGIEDEAAGVLWSDAMGATDTAVTISGNGPFFVRLENVAATTDGAQSATQYLCGLRRIEP